MNFVAKLVIAAVALILAAGTSGQESPTSDSSQNGVVLVKLAPPIYPQIARSAHVSGDVELKVNVRQDGSVESADFVSGPPILQWAAQNSAKQSQFECRKCSDEITSYRIVYTFQIDETAPCCQPNEPAPRVSQSDNHVTLIAPRVCLCGSTVPTKVRSLRCLYLWKCRTLHYE